MPDPRSAGGGADAGAGEEQVRQAAEEHETDAHGESESVDEPRRPTVLVVDDELLILRSTRIVLEAAGFLVATAQGGEEALEVVRSDRPDVVLLDIMMPGVDGWETLSRLRADVATRDIPVVIFTAREHVRGRQLAREMGAVDYMPKPYDPDALVDLLRSHASVPVRGRA